MKIERIESLPLVYYWLEQMRVASIIDEIWARPSKWQGLSYGQLAVLFIMYVIESRTHRLSAMEDWVVSHRQTLEAVTGWQIGEKDATDDRLGQLVERLGRAELSQQSYHHQAGQHLIKAYELPTDVARFDTTTFNVYHQPEDEEQGLLKFGYSKDKRPDLLQFKQSLGTLDPAGVPLYTQTLAGHQADDPLYVPAWRAMCETIGHSQFLFVGDCKGAALDSRATISEEGGFYLFPLALTGVKPQQLTQFVLSPPTPPTPIELPDETDGLKAVGQGFKVAQSMTSETGYRWSETWLITQSTALAQRQQQALHQRLDKTEKHLQQLTAKAGETGQAFLQRAQTLIQSRKLTDLLTVELTQTGQLTKKYLGRGRPGPNRPYRFISHIDYHLTVTRNPKQIEQALTLSGWRIYVTNYTPLTPTEATLYYRGQWTNERGYHRFKRGSLPALPLFLRIPERIKGVMFLLMIALQLLCLIEFVVQRNLAQQQTQVEGLVPGNPKIKTARPSAERIFAQFEGIHLLIQDQALQRVEPLTPLQRFLLELMNTPEHIYHFF